MGIKNEYSSVSIKNKIDRLSQKSNNILNPITKIRDNNNNLFLAKQTSKEADYYFFKKDYETAKKLYKESINLYSDLKKEGVNSYYALAKCYLELGDEKLAKFWYKETLVILKKYNIKNYLYKLVLVDISDLFISAKEYHKAEAVLKKITDEYQNSNTEEELRTVKQCFTKLADIYNIISNFTEKANVISKLNNLNSSYLHVPL